MRYEWAKGFTPPKGVEIEDVAAAIEELPEPSPDNLFERSKDPDHVLHDHLWSQGDQYWANKARRMECRKIITNVRVVHEKGDKEVTVRQTEFVRQKEDTRWVSMNDIISSDDLEESYMEEILRLQENVADKLRRFKELKSLNKK